MEEDPDSGSASMISGAASGAASGASSAPSQAPNLIGVDRLISHLRQICSGLLEDDGSGTQALEEALQVRAAG